MLRIVSKASSQEEFVSVFHRFCDSDAMFVVTKAPKEVGTDTRFAITLADGKPMLMGLGHVKEAHDGRENRFQRPGMLLSFRELTADSRAVLEELVKAREDAKEVAIAKLVAARKATTASASPAPGVPQPAAATPAASDASPRALATAATPAKQATPGNESAPGNQATPASEPAKLVTPAKLATLAKKTMLGLAPPLAAPPPGESGARPLPGPPLKVPMIVPRPGPRPALPDPGDHDHDQDDEDEDTQVASDRRMAVESAGDIDQRVAGSTFILPANPFGEVTEESLEAFVECTLYEESGMVELPPDEVSERGEGTPTPLPPWWPRAGTPAPGDWAGATPPPGDWTAARATPPPAAAPGTQTAPVQRAAAPTAAPPGPAMPPAAGSMAAPGPGPMPPYQPGPVPAAMMPHAVPVYPRPMGEATELVPRMPRSPWGRIALVAVATSLLSLGLGYLIWGNGSSDPRAAGAAEPAPPAESEPEPETEPETEPEPETETETDTAADPVDVAVAVADPETEPETDAEPEPEPEPEPETDTGAHPDPDPVNIAVAEPADSQANAAVDPVLSDGDGCPVAIDSRPGGATVAHEGKTLGKTPLETTLPCGTVELTVSSSRYQDASTRTTLKPDRENRVTVQLERPTHTLAIKSAPAGASVFVNGRRIGRTPTTIRVKGYQRSSVRLKHPGYKTWSSRVYVGKPTTSVNARLVRSR